MPRRAMRHRPARRADDPGGSRRPAPLRSSSPVPEGLRNGSGDPSIRGRTRLSKYGTARLRRAFRRAGQAAILQRANSFRGTSSNATSPRIGTMPVCGERRHSTAHAVVRGGDPCRPFFEGAIHGGRTFPRPFCDTAVEASIQRATTSQRTFRPSAHRCQDLVLRTLRAALRRTLCLSGERPFVDDALNTRRIGTCRDHPTRQRPGAQISRPFRTWDVVTDDAGGLAVDPHQRTGFARDPCGRNAGVGGEPCRAIGPSDNGERTGSRGSNRRSLPGRAMSAIGSRTMASEPARGSEGVRYRAMGTPLVRGIRARVQRRHWFGIEASGIGVREPRARLRPRRRLAESPSSR